ncbi:MAG: helix-turn-helix transcriptional regulator [Anaerolineae bacterium]|nr:helix-turn-helix transcriptional regulator [Anaerolineae bacterium]
MNDRLYQWLRNQIDERDWSDSEFARRTEFSKSYVSAVFSHQRNATADFCLAAARALHADPAFVLGLAGHLPPTLQERRADDPILDEACDILERLPRERQAVALLMLHGLSSKRPAERMLGPPAEGGLPVGGLPATAMENTPASTAETNSGPATAEGAELAQEIEQMFYSILDSLAQADNPHRQAYDVLWDATQTLEEKRLLARMLAAAAQKYERGGESGKT